MPLSFLDAAANRPLIPAEPAWLTDSREKSRLSFESMGLPTPRLESWKYTRLKTLEDTTFGLAGAAAENVLAVRAGKARISLLFRTIPVRVKPI